MKFVFLLAMLFFLNGCAEKTEEIAGPTPSGYVLKSEKGIYLPGSDSSIVVKASPELGSQNDIAVVQKIGPGKGTGLHYHEDADEIFYVIAGTGTVVLGTRIFTIETGDFIFIPKNLDHKIRKYDSSGVLQVVFFMDKPGLWEFFKERHKQFEMDRKTMTLEELNELSKKHGTYFKTLR
jgi:mannose-6-phosphate isomerase-like protein (cupin superfamily)